MTHWLDKVQKILSAETADLRELAALAGADARTFYVGIDPKTLDLEAQDLEGIQFSTPEPTGDERADVSRIFALVLPLRRQEERMVLLLRELAAEGAARAAIAKSYPTSTKFEAQALDSIRQSSGLLAATTDAAYSVALIKILSRLYQLSFTERKGLLLYFIAKHLRHQPQVPEFVRTKLRRSQSNHVLKYEDQILQVLDP